MTRRHRLMVQLLTNEHVERIVDEAMRTLEEIGVFLYNAEAMELLHGAGAQVSDSGTRALIPRAMVEECRAAAPRTFTLYDRDGHESFRMGGGIVRFVPGSAATLVYDHAARAARRPTTRDLVEFVALTDMLPAYDAQSTGIVPDDVPASVADRYRLFLALVYGRKPVVTGTFIAGAFETMHDFLVTVRGDAAALRAKPLSVFDCCPTSPLTWIDPACQALLDCARAGVPAALVPAPLIGATSPVTLAGTLVQLTAENLSGVVIHQCASPGSPLVWGGAPAVFDMRTGVAAMAAPEAATVAAAAARIGKSLGLPVQGYLGLSDAKTPDFQAGFESTFGAVLAVLGGVDLVAGGGMLHYANCQSPEKLVADNEVFTSARRLAEGIRFRDREAVFELISDCVHGGSFLGSEHTSRFFRQEVQYPSGVIDRSSHSDWLLADSPDATVRAHERVLALLHSSKPPPLDEDQVAELEHRMLNDATAAGADSLPDWRWSG